MNLILFGFKKCGKTYYGLKVAQRMHMRFLDTDLLIEELYTKRYHQTHNCKEIVDRHGLEVFRELEQQVIYSLVQIDNCVVALGGGAVFQENNVEHLKKVGTLVYIKASKEVIKHRILSGEIPAYIDKKHPQDSFESMYKERKPIYERIQAFCVDTENKTEEQVVTLLCNLVESIKAHYGK